MKKVFFVGLIAMLMSCTQENISHESSDVELQVSLSLGRISTRAVDGSIIGDDGKGYVLPFTEIKTLEVELYKSLDESTIYTYTASSKEIEKIKATTGEFAQLSILKIPSATRYVKVIINQFSTTNPTINHLQVTNQDDSPAPTMTRENIPYEGISTEIIVVPEESTSLDVKVKAIVEVAPVLSRFEIIPGTIEVVNPADKGYTFDWTDGTTGRTKITQFTEAEILNAEASARENFKKKHGADASAAATYSYRISLIRSPFPDNFDINNATTGFYMNYFKLNLNSTTLIKNSNDGISDWNMSAGYAGYKKGGEHSNMYDTKTSDPKKVNAFHLFPQSAATNATLTQVKDGMPHIIFGFSADSFKRWLTIRAFRDKSNEQIIDSFLPGYCYSLDLDDVILTPWSLGLEVRITDNGKTAESDPIIKDFDQTSYVPEPDGLGLIIGLKVSKWREKDLEVEL